MLHWWRCREKVRGRGVGIVPSDVSQSLLRREGLRLAATRGQKIIPHSGGSQKCKFSPNILKKNKKEGGSV